MVLNIGHGFARVAVVHPRPLSGPFIFVCQTILALVYYDEPRRSRSLFRLRYPIPPVECPRSNWSHSLTPPPPNPLPPYHSLLAPRTSLPSPGSLHSSPGRLHSYTSASNSRIAHVWEWEVEVGPGTSKVRHGYELALINCGLGTGTCRVKPSQAGRGFLILIEPLKHAKDQRTPGCHYVPVGRGYLNIYINLPACTLASNLTYIVHYLHSLQKLPILLPNHHAFSTRTTFVDIADTINTLLT